MSIGIIGGGPNGLTALIECLNLNLQVKLYEKQRNIGGTWNLESNESQAHVSTRFNTSTLVSSLDLEEPLSKYYEEEFVTCSQYFRYLKVLVDKYKLKPHITFNSNIVNIVRENGKFTLHDDKYKKYVHDYVIVSTGRFGNEIIPDELKEKKLSFDKAPYFHTRYWDLVKPNKSSVETIEKDGLRMLIVGGSFSAGESLQEILLKYYEEGNLKKMKIYWSLTRNPDKVNVWMMDRMPFKGKKKSLPWDQNYNRSILYKDELALPRILKDMTAPLNLVSDDALYRLGIDRITICNVSLIQRAIKEGVLEIINEPIEIMHNKEKSTEPNAKAQFRLKKSNKTESVDCVLLGTGYEYAEPTVTIAGNKKKLVSEGGLFRDMIPTQLELNYKIGFLCTTKATSSLFGMVQMEVRWLLHNWFFDKCEFLKREVPIWSSTRNLSVKSTLNDGTRLPIMQMEVLAADIPGCLPNPLKSLFSLFPSTRKLALAQLLGPWTVHHYNWPCSSDISAEIKEKFDEKRRREFILCAAEESFEKSKTSFNSICFWWSTIYMTGCSISALAIYKILREFGVIYHIKNGVSNVIKS